MILTFRRCRRKASPTRTNLKSSDPTGGVEMPAPPVGINFRKIAVDKSKNIQYNSEVEKRTSRCGSVWVAARVRDAGQQIRPRPVGDVGRICWRSGRRLARRFTRRRQSREPQEGRAGSEFLFQRKAYRDVAQFGRALRSGRRGRRFESCHLDHKSQMGIAHLRFIFVQTVLSL